MNKNAPLTIGVIGSGVIGTLTAYTLKKKNYSVSLFDEYLPGTQTSMGNAGTFAHYACIPINSEDNFKKIPFLLFSDSSPLSIQWKNLFSIYPWLIKFLQNCSKEKVNNIITQLSIILQKASIANNNLFNEINFGSLINNNETLYLYETEKDFLRDKKNNDLRKSKNIDLTEISSREINEIEPNLNKNFYRGTLFKGSKFTTNPLKFVNKIYEEFLKNNGKFFNKKIIKIKNEENKIIIQDNLNDSYKFDKLIICTGSFSNNLANMLGETFPMITERGYHLMYKDYKNIISRPISVVNQGMYYIPMEEGLRAAGTVEIGINDNSINTKRTNWMHKNTISNFNINNDPNKVWLGYRPTLPDSLPVIGKSKNNENIIYNFGHQHLGLTLATISAEIILNIIEDKKNKDFETLSPNRFN